MCCGITLNDCVPPKFPSKATEDYSGKTALSGSKLPIANCVTVITFGTRNWCDPAFTAAEPRPQCLAVRRRGRWQATTSGLSFFEDEEKKGPKVKVLPKPRPRVEALCAIHNANVRVALPFQTLGGTQPSSCALTVWTVVHRSPACRQDSLVLGL